MITAAGKHKGGHRTDILRDKGTGVETLGTGCDSVGGKHVLRARQETMLCIGENTVGDRYCYVDTLIKKKKVQN